MGNKLGYYSVGHSIDFSVAGQNWRNCSKDRSVNLGELLNSRMTNYGLISLAIRRC